MKEFSIFSLEGIGGFFVLVLDIWAIISVVNSNASTGAKVIWVLLIAFLPIVGFVIWLLAGPRSTTNTI